ncbi:MAG: 50S ribosomal protein L4 [Dehalococcoidia bacterium]|nr:50S ribosomal protein L4 [Dehalococcoidia bacterium]
MKLDVRNLEGAVTQQIDADDSVFGIDPNAAVVHQTLLAQLAARHTGQHSTLTRGEVRGSTRKIRRQKGLGAARQGAIRSPIHRGGGVVFGPKPRSYAQALPKRMRRLAIRSVLASRARDQRLYVIDGLSLETPSTKAMVKLLGALGIERSVLVVTGAPDRAVFASARNVPGAHVLPADTINVADMLAHQSLILTVDAVRRIEALWGGVRAGGRPRGTLAAVEA